MKRYDFVIVGAGVVGSWISWELSKRENSVCVIEKNSSSCMGTSKANSAIVHAGYDPVPGTLMAKLNVRGNELIRERCKDMAIPFRMVGSLVLAFDDDGIKAINELFARGRFNGVEGLRILTRDEVLSEEPSLSGDVKGALLAPTGGICSPFDLTDAPLEIALTNGVEFYPSTELRSVEKADGGFVLNGEIFARCVINASGVDAARVAALFGDRSFTIYPRKGEYSLLDKEVGSIIHHTIFQPPTKLGKGILVSPTVDGNILVGPNAEDIRDPYDTSTTTPGQEEIFIGGRRSVPSISERNIITSFSGVRAVSDRKDFIIEFSSVDRLFNVAGICSPGLTAAPAIAEYVAHLLEEKGLLGEEKKSYSSSRRVVRFMELGREEKIKALKENPLYGRVICRCEGVTEGEIVDAIHRPNGARTLDDVKRKVRAGMGRCQGGFCTPRVIEILSRELNIPYTEVKKFSERSYLTLEKEGGDNE